jgi:hypothetical protein
MQARATIAEIQRMGNKLLLPHCRLAKDACVKDKRSCRNQSSALDSSNRAARTEPQIDKA